MKILKKLRWVIVACLGIIALTLYYRWNSVVAIAVFIALLYELIREIAHRTQKKKKYFMEGIINTEMEYLILKPAYIEIMLLDTRQKPVIRQKRRFSLGNWFFVRVFENLVTFTIAKTTFQVALDDESLNFFMSCIDDYDGYIRYIIADGDAEFYFFIKESE